MSIAEILKGDWKMLRLLDLDRKKEFEIFADDNIGKRGKIYHVIYDDSFKSYPAKVDLKNDYLNKNIRLLETKFK